MSHYSMTDMDWQVITAPMKHQVAAVEKMLPSKVGGLFMDMGTGKSLVAIILAFMRRHKINKFVWCCPVSLKINAIQQILTHTNSPRSSVYVFDNKTTDTSLPDAFWYIVGLESVSGSSRVTMALNKLVDSQTMMIVDESSFIKGHKALRTRRLKLIGQRARYRMILNGTPITQGIEDLYTQITFLSEKILGYRSWYAFARYHLEYSDKYKGKIVDRKKTELLSAKIAPYIYQVTKEECLDLPAKTFSRRDVGLTGEQENMCEIVRDRFADDLMKYERGCGIAIFRLFSALHAIVNGVVPAGFKNHGEAIETRKTEALIQTLRQIAGHEPVVVFVNYQRSVNVVAETIQNELGRNVVKYYGAFSEKKRGRELECWRNEGGFLVATTGCGGFGLTLTESRYAIFFSNNFKYSQRLQSEDRLHRISQEKSVHYTDIWADAGIERRIRAAIECKGDALKMFRNELEMMQKKGGGWMNELMRSV
ncbi:DEAD/DEAH box helicase [Salmonella enterica]|nr:DEAD/DEAH box helicase [Salmonella enterica]